MDQHFEAEWDSNHAEEGQDLVDRFGKAAKEYFARGVNILYDAAWEERRLRRVVEEKNRELEKKNASLQLELDASKLEEQRLLRVLKPHYEPGTWGPNRRQPPWGQRRPSAPSFSTALPITTPSTMPSIAASDNIPSNAASSITPLDPTPTSTTPPQRDPVRTKQVENLEYVQYLEESEHVAPAEDVEQAEVIEAVEAEEETGPTPPRTCEGCDQQFSSGGALRLHARDCVKTICTDCNQGLGPEYIHGRHRCPARRTRISPYDRKQYQEREDGEEEEEAEAFEIE